MKTQKSNYTNLDIAKFVCALLVVMIHASPVAGASEWVQFYGVNVLARIAVPLFFGMSGYLFFGRLIYENGRIKACTENRTKLLRQIRRNAILYLGWSAAYLLVIQIPNWYHTGWWGPIAVKDYLFSLVFKCGYYHMWYLLAMLYAVPVLYGILSLISVRKAVLVTALLWVCECLVYSYSWIGVDRIAPVMLIGTKMPIIFDTLFRAVPLLFTGVLLSQEPPNGRAYGWATLIAVLLCAGEATMLYTLQPQSGCYSYLFLTFPMSYLLLRFLLCIKPVCLDSYICTQMGRISTTIYFIHPMVIVFLSPLALPEGFFHYCVVVLLSALCYMGNIGIQTGVIFLQKMCRKRFRK